MYLNSKDHIQKNRISWFGEIRQLFLYAPAYISLFIDYITGFVFPLFVEKIPHTLLTMGTKGKLKDIG